MSSEIFGARLRRLRKARGLKLKELGYPLGLLPQAISAWESGVNRVHHNQIAPLADILRVTTDYLLTGREAPAYAALLAAVRATAPTDARLVALVGRIG
jgi:transcriptional regulator with XRE-family HTH domain